MNKKQITDDLHPKQPGFVLATDCYQKYNLMNYGISHFYCFHANSSTMSGIPDACVDILFSDTKGTLSTRIAGTLLKSAEVETVSSRTYFGVRFLPGYNPVSRFAKVEELISKEENFAEMLPQKERMCLLTNMEKAASFREKIQVFMEHYLEYIYEQSQGSYDLKSFLRGELNRSCGNIKLYDMSSSTGYSLRYLNRVIHEEYGMSPKELLKILRFQRAIDKMTSKGENTTLTDTALESGYYDQSHFIREFKEFTNITPKNYISSLYQNSYQDRLKLIKE